MLIATIASGFASRLLVSLPSVCLIFSLTISGELLPLSWLLNLIFTLIIITVFIVLFLVGGVHLRRSSAIGRGRGLLVVNLVN